MSSTHITVGICTFNRKAMLEQALKSLFSLRTNGTIEYDILVVDDASPDDSYSMCRSIQASSPVPMRVIQHQVNSGVAVSRNTCVRHATGDWIAFFDDDEIADPRWLVNLYRTALMTGADIVGGPYRLFDAGNDLPRSLRRVFSENPVMQRSLPRRFALDPRKRQSAMPAAMGTGNVLIRKSLFDRVGLFSESRRRGEDIEFFLKASKAGASFAVAPDAIIYHVIPPERLAADYLLRSARSGGAMHGQIELEVLGKVRACWNGLLRCAHLGLVTVPRMLKAYVLRDHGDLLGWQCRALFAVSYLGAVVFPEPV